MYLINDAPITDEEERQLVPLAQAGCMTSRRRLVTGNLGYLLKIAPSIRGRVELHDAVQEMAIVLWETIPKFRVGKGRLCAYAMKAFKWRLRRVEKATSYQVYIPDHFYDDKTADVAKVAMKAGRDDARDLLDRSMGPDDEACASEGLLS